MSAQHVALEEREPVRPERPRDHGAVELDWQVAGHVELANARAASACGETDARVRLCVERAVWSDVCNSNDWR